MVEERKTICLLTGISSALLVSVDTKTYFEWKQDGEPREHAWRMGLWSYACDGRMGESLHRSQCMLYL